MHRRLREVEGLLREWCRSDYGSQWLRMAMEEHGVIRVKPGQFIPVVHFVALGDRPIYIAPQQRVRPGHRMVGPDQFKSGHALEEGELALGPEIRLDVVQDRALLAAAARFDTSPRVPGVKDPSQIFRRLLASLSLQMDGRRKRSCCISTYLVKAPPILMTAFSMSE
jgi:hypothetical protein